MDAKEMLATTSKGKSGQMICFYTGEVRRLEIKRRAQKLGYGSTSAYLNALVDAVGETRPDAIRSALASPRAK